MRKLSKILVLVLALAMMFTMASLFTASAAEAEETKTIYFKPPTSGHWHQGNERYAVYSWGGSTGDTWHDLKDSDGDGVYSAEIPAGDTKVIFCRMNKGATANNWSNKWNQSADYSLGITDLNTVYFTVANSDSQNCAVSKYSYTPPVNAHVCTPVVIVEESVAVTCITSGLEVTKCSDPTCGLREETVLAPAHTFVSGVCSACGFNTKEAHTVYFKNTSKWTKVNAYYWGESNPVTWPGTAITESNGLYSVTIPAGSYNVIFNDGASQTDDLVVPAEPMVYNLETKAWEELPHVHSWSEATCTELSKCECGETQGELAPHNMVAGEVVAPTYSAGGYTVYTCSGCGATENRDATDKLVPAFPEATVTPVEKDDLTFALNFGIKGVSVENGELVLDPEVFTEEYLNAVLNTYGKMYVDYRLTISGLTDPSVTLNGDGTADAYLAGQYDAWSENWVYVPFGDSVVIENGKSLMIMEYAAELMGKPGLRQILEEIVTIVVDFNCGVYFTPEFLEHNPDMVVTLELLVFNEDENGELTDVITVAENVFTVPHEHSFVEGECECGELDPAYVNTLVVGDTNKIIVNGDTLNDYLLPIEWVMFTADEKAHYEFVGNNGALCFIFDMEGNLVCLGTGKADLEAGTYLICVGNGATGVLNVAVTKSEIAVPEHENKLVIGENNKIVVDGSILNANGNPIAWVPFVVTEKAHYAMTSETEGALVYIFDTSYNLVCGATGAAVLEPGTYLVCVGNGAVGDIYVQVTRTEISADCEHVYYYMNCTLCGAVNPHFEYNLMVAGSNKVICNEYHLVDTTGHGNPYQFTTFTLTEGGTYKFTSDKLVGFTIFTTEVSTEGADWTAGTGASWGVYIAGDEATLEAGTYYIGLIFVDGVGEYTINIDKVVEEQPPVDEPADEPELNFFQKILAWFMELIQKILAIFKR